MFKYTIGTTWELVSQLLEHRMKDVYLDPKVAAQCLIDGPDAIRRHYGPAVHPLGIGPPGVSYVHLSTLGAEIAFPEDDGEPNVRPVRFSSLREATDHIRKPVDFGECRWVRFGIEFSEKMSELVGKTVPWGFAAEGPITSAALYYGNDFYAEMAERPQEAIEFLAAMTESIVSFVRWIYDEQGRSASAHGICDDLASLVSPDMWGKFVLPFWEDIYSGCGCDRGARWLHCENLGERHLPLINEMGLSSFDPSRAPQLTPELVGRHVRCPWYWRVQIAHVWAGRDVVREQIEQAAKHGANVLTCFTSQEFSRQDVEFIVETAEKCGGQAI